MNLSRALPFVSFMAEALYGAHGYYTRGVNFLQTPPRDFTTAPELTPLFGATLANWVARQWQALGCPTPFVLAEMGPGRGSLMHPLLTHLHHAHPACFAALARVHLIETSPALTHLQQQTLAPWADLCTWAETLPQGHSLPPLLLIANEVLDALPVQPYRYNNGQWEALHVEPLAPEPALVWCTAEPPTLPAGLTPTQGTVYEHRPALLPLLAHIQAQAHAALLLDYGAPSLPPQGAETLQALQNHTPVPLLHQPGDTDLTAHIAFNEVSEALGPAHCTLATLTDFLLHHGLPQLALPLLPHPATESALHRLLHPAHMGTLHLALCYTRSTR